MSCAPVPVHESAGNVFADFGLPDAEFYAPMATPAITLTAKLILASQQADLNTLKKKPCLP
jgi:hypothetical protein